MTVVSVLLASLALSQPGLQAQKAPPTRVIEVKPAGLAVSVPKSWGNNTKEAAMVASLKIPIPGSKNFGRMDIGYVADDSKDVDGFLEASKSVLTVGGNTIERQWKVDIMDSPLALTRYSKNGATTVRGVLFRSSKSKFIITISSVTDEFSKVEPFLMSTLETLKEIKVVQPKQPVVATEKKIPILRDNPGKPVKLPLSHAISAGGKGLVLHLPAGTKTTDQGEGMVAIAIPGIEGMVTLKAYQSDANPPSQVYQTKTAESSKLFKGAIQRVDQSFPNNPDKQNRDMVWRTGLAEKSGGGLLTCDCVITQPTPIFLYAYFQSTNAKQFKRDQKAVTKFLLTVNLAEK